MKTYTKHILLFLLLAFASGCGNSDLVSVSGTVTYDGQPVEGVLVVFSPEVQGENHFPGPFSTGTTDSSGNYTLKTKKGSRGAVVGPHKVGFNWAKLSPMELSMLEGDYAAAVASETPKDELAEMKAKIDELKSEIESRPPVVATVNRKFEVPASGTSDANFELAE